MNKINRWAVLECCVLLENKSPEEIKDFHFFEPNQIILAQKLLNQLKSLEISQ